ncbi:unnamed protein product [Closterium sp. NIES-54]
MHGGRGTIAAGMMEDMCGAMGMWCHGHNAKFDIHESLNVAWMHGLACHGMAWHGRWRRCSSGPWRRGWRKTTWCWKSMRSSWHTTGPLRTVRGPCFEACSTSRPRKLPPGHPPRSCWHQRVPW